MKIINLDLYCQVATAGVKLKFPFTVVCLRTVHSFSCVFNVYVHTTDNPFCVYRCLLVLLLPFWFSTTEIKREL